MKIEIILNTTEFEQDIRPLVMAFFPGSTIKVITDDTNDIGREAVPEAPDYLLDVKTECGNEHIRFFERSSLITEKWAGDDHHMQTTSRLYRKNRLKRTLYQIFAEYTKKQLPWGTLTGIRPVKLPVAMLEQGRTKQEIHDSLKAEYLMSDEKISLAAEIAERERTLLQKMDCENGYSLYIGIPFCPSTCAYCSFTSYPLSKWKNQVDRYLDAVEKELDFWSDYCQGKVLDTLYIGGGTPTTLEPAQLSRLFEMIEKRFPAEHALEWSVEAGRPDSITREKLAVMRAHPITRISINPQTMKQETLALIGRRHTVEQTVEAFYLAREMGFDNINMDLIMGLPDETEEDVLHTMERIEALAPDSLTVHSLAIKRAARLNTQKQEFADRKIVNTEEMHSLVEQKARQMGLLPYYLYRQKNMAGNLENVGYAKEGKFGIYNILIMEEVQSIYGAGAGSASKIVVTKDRHERTENVKDVAHYMNRIDEMIERKKKILYGVSVQG